MSLRAIQQEVDEIFDNADHPNIVHKDDYDYKKLSQVHPKLPVPERDSIEIIKDILEGIVYISSHLLIYKPCQVFKEHVIMKHGKWGICNLICYRDKNESLEFDENRYWPIDYDEHPNQDTELTWFIGRLWYELLTDATLPPIKALSQEEVDSLVDTSGIKDISIVPLLKLVLQVDPSKRITLQDMMNHSFFEYNQNSMLNLQSVLPTSSLLMADGFREAGKFTVRVTGYNPFKEELFKRDFKQALVVADLFDKVKNWIFDNFEVKDSQNEIDFSCYLIELMSYLKLKKYQVDRDMNQYDLVILEDKQDYTKFMEKVLFLEKKLNKRRKIKKFDEFKEKKAKCLCMLEDIDYELVEKEFKGYLSTYAEHLQKERIRNQKESPRYIKNYVTMIFMLLVRCSKYIFSNCRKYLFEDFIDPSGFDLKKVILNIEECTDVKKLARIDEKIQALYFDKRLKPHSTHQTP